MNHTPSLTFQAMLLLLLLLPVGSVGQQHWLGVQFMIDTKLSFQTFELIKAVEQLNVSISALAQLSVCTRG